MPLAAAQTSSDTGLCLDGETALPRGLDIVCVPKSDAKKSCPNGTYIYTDQENKVCKALMNSTICADPDGLDDYKPENCSPYELNDIVLTPEQVENRRALLGLVTDKAELETDPDDKPDADPVPQNSSDARQIPEKTLESSPTTSDTPVLIMVIAGISVLALVIVWRLPRSGNNRPTPPPATHPTPNPAKPGTDPSRMRTAVNPSTGPASQPKSPDKPKSTPPKSSLDKPKSTPPKSKPGIDQSPMRTTINPITYPAPPPKSKPVIDQSSMRTAANPDMDSIPTLPKSDSNKPKSTPRPKTKPGRTRSSPRPKNSPSTNISPTPPKSKSSRIKSSPRQASGSGRSNSSPRQASGSSRTNSSAQSKSHPSTVTPTDKQVLYAIDTNVICKSFNSSEDFYNVTVRFLRDQISKNRLHISETVMGEIDHRADEGIIPKDQFNKSNVGKYWTADKNHQYIKIPNTIKKNILRNLKRNVGSSRSIDPILSKTPGYSINLEDAHKAMLCMINAKFESIWKDPTKAEKVKEYVSKKTKHLAEDDKSKNNFNLGKSKYALHDKQIFADAVLLDICNPEPQVRLVSFDRDLFHFSEELEVFGVTVYDGSELRLIKNYDDWS